MRKNLHQSKKKFKSIKPSLRSSADKKGEKIKKEKNKVRKNTTITITSSVGNGRP